MPQELLDDRGMIVEPMPPQQRNEGTIKEMAVKLMAAKVELEEVLEEGDGDCRLAIPPNALPTKKESWEI